MKKPGIAVILTDGSEFPALFQVGSALTERERQLFSALRPE
jgi:hypothetical protein